MTTSTYNYGGRTEVKHNPYTIKSLKNKLLKNLMARRPKSIVKTPSSCT